MKSLLTLILCTALLTGANAQDMYKQIMDYHRKGDFSIGFKTGEITGINAQYFKALTCSTEKYTNFFMKTHAFDLTIGPETLLFSQKNPYHGQTLNTGGWRGSFNYLHSVYNFSYIHFYLGAGIQTGWHKVETMATNPSGTGINGLIGAEWLVARVGGRNDPFFVTAFVEGGKYWELTESYNRTVLNFGVRFNNWRH